MVCIFLFPWFSIYTHSEKGTRIFCHVPIHFKLRASVFSMSNFALHSIVCVQILLHFASVVWSCALFFPYVVGCTPSPCNFLLLFSYYACTPHFSTKLCFIIDVYQPFSFSRRAQFFIMFFYHRHAPCFFRCTIFSIFFGRAPSF